MKIEKRTFGANVKLSKDYNSVSISEGFEATIENESDLKQFVIECQNVYDKVFKEAKVRLKYLSGKEINLSLTKGE